MFVVSMIALVTGLGLAGWAVVDPQPTKYIAGVILASGSAAILLYRWRRHRRGAPRGKEWRFRLRAGALSTGVAVLLAAVLIAVPHLDRRSEIQDGVIWTAEGMTGQLTVVAGTPYLTDPIDGAVLGAVDLGDGSLAWSAPGGRWLTQEGGVIAVDADVLHYYNSQGAQEWQFEVAGGEEEVDAVYAARDGYVVFADCSSDGPACRFVGIDRSGQKAWEQNLDVTGAFLDAFVAWDGELLPEVVTVVQSQPERGLLIDPESGEILGDFPMENVREQFVYGDVLVTGGGSGDECRLDGFRITDGEHLWRVDELCASQEYAYPLPPSWAGTDALMYAVVEEDSDPQSLLAVSMADGAARELPAWDVGPSTSVRPLDIEDYSAGDLLFRWGTVDVAAVEATTLEQRWQVEAPGARVRSVSGDSETVAIVSHATPSGHNPMVPPLAEEEERGLLEYPTHVTVVDAASGEIVSTTLVPTGVRGLQALPGHQVLLKTFEGLMLVGGA